MTLPFALGRGTSLHAWPSQRRATELHVIVQMLQVMETAWLSLNLDVHYAHPLNRERDAPSAVTASRTRADRWSQNKGDGSGTSTPAAADIADRSSAM